MKTLNQTAAALALGLAAAASPLIAHAADIEHFTLPNGAQVWFSASPSLPMLDVRIDFDAGSRRDPAGKAGLANATAHMSDKGVRAAGKLPALSESQLGEAWADLGAQFSASASRDLFSWRLRTLTDEKILPRAIDLAARQIGQSAFSAPVWKRERERMQAALAESLTRPGTVARRAFDQALYSGHPYGQHTSAQSLAAIDVKDMQAFYRRAATACAARVSMVGAITREQAASLASALLAHLPAAGPKACTEQPAIAEVPPLAKSRRIDIPFDSAQAHVLIGQPGYKRNDADHFALLVGNHVLGGGGFASRLMHEVREKRGLSYGAYSQFSPMLHAGAFSIGLQTRPDQAAQALQVAQQVLAEFVQQGPSEAELKAAKDNLIGGFALLTDSNAKLLAQIANIAAYDLPADYLKTWPAQVEKVTAADVRAAFARVLAPERMVTVVLGAPAGQAAK